MNRKGNSFTREEALNKVYIIKAKGNGYSGYIYVPHVLEGERVKLQLV